MLGYDEKGQTVHCDDITNLMIPTIGLDPRKQMGGWDILCMHCFLAWNICNWMSMMEGLSMIPRKYIGENK